MGGGTPGCFSASSATYPIEHGAFALSQAYAHPWKVKDAIVRFHGIGRLEGSDYRHRPVLGRLTLRILSIRGETCRLKDSKGSEARCSEASCLLMGYVLLLIYAAGRALRVRYGVSRILLVCTLLAVAVARVDIVLRNVS